MLIEQIPGMEIGITRDGKSVAQLFVERKTDAPRRKLGTLKGSVLYMAPDVHAPLEASRNTWNDISCRLPGADLGGKLLPATVD